MICKSCKEEINFKMKKALKANECPYCGGEILDKEKMMQFVDLQEVLTSQRFTDNSSVDERIKDKVIRVLMEHMRCIKTKDLSHEEDIVKLGNSEASQTPLKKSLSNIPASVGATPVVASSINLVEEQGKMRENIYRQVVEEQYGDKGAELSEEDIEAAEGVVFSANSTGEGSTKAERLKSLAPTRDGKSKPISRIQ